MAKGRGKTPDYLKLIESAGANYEPAPAALSPVEVELLAPPAIVAEHVVEINGEAVHVALGEWERIGAHLMRLELVGDLDLWPLAAYCLAVANFVGCEYEIIRLGGIAKSGGEYTTSGRNGTQYKARPVVARRQEALAALRSAADDFGLTPRARVNMSRAAQEDLFSRGGGQGGGVEGRLAGG